MIKINKLTVEMFLDEDKYWIVVISDYSKKPIGFYLLIHNNDKIKMLRFIGQI